MPEPRQPETPSEEQMVPPTDIVGSVRAISALEKGGLFVILLVVLYLGYNMYLKNLESSEKSVANQLAVIAQQQVNLQQSLNQTQAQIQASAQINNDLLRKMEGIEGTMIQFVYSTSDQLVLRTPSRDGAKVVTLNILKEKS